MRRKIEEKCKFDRGTEAYREAEQDDEENDIPAKSKYVEKYGCEKIESRENYDDSCEIDSHFENTHL